MKEARRENKGGFNKINMKIAAAAAPLEASNRIIDNVLFGKNMYKQKHENYGKCGYASGGYVLCCASIKIKYTGEKF